MSYLVRNTSTDDIPYLSMYLREADKQELVSLTGETVSNCLFASISGSTYCKTIEIDGSPEGVFGAWPTEALGVGGIWMVATDGLFKDNSLRMAFLRNCKEYIKHIMEIGNYTRLNNWTDARNVEHHAWLKWCGARFLDPMSIGKNGEDYIPFWIMKEDID